MCGAISRTSAASVACMLVCSPSAGFRITHGPVLRAVRPRRRALGSPGAARSAPSSGAGGAAPGSVRLALLPRLVVGAPPAPAARWGLLIGAEGDRHVLQRGPHGLVQRSLA